MHLFNGVLDALQGLKAGIADVHAAWQGGQSPSPKLAPRSAARPRRPSLGAPDPWDADSAEALTRVWEMAAGEDLKRAKPRRPAAKSEVASAAAAVTGSERGGSDALEARLVRIADRLAAGLPRPDPQQWLAPLEARVRQLECRVAAAMQEATGRPERQSLDAVEAQLGGLVKAIDEAREELCRLDAIETQLGEMVQQLKSLKTAAKVFAAAARPRSADATRVDGLIKACASGRRQDARVAVDVLKSIHHAIADIADRLNQTDGAPAHLEAPAPGGTDPHADRDLLLKAYREGARALGEMVPDLAADPLAKLASGRGHLSAEHWRWHDQD